MTREEWLEKVVDHLRPLYSKAEVPIPEKIRISFGWPSKNALSTKARRIGECWIAECASDTVNQIFISPILDSARDAVGVIAHELVHAALPPEAAHKAPFIKACKKVGLTDGKPKNVMPGPELWREIDDILAHMIPYPHAALTPRTKDKTQTTRMLKIQCTDSSHEPYILRGSKKVFALGIPNCPICGELMFLEDAEDGEKEDK